MTVEPWLQGPVPDVPAELQPAAHALLNARLDVRRITDDGITDRELHARPGGAASVAFHYVHLDGALDRLLTYAAGHGLSEGQRGALAQESDGHALDALTPDAALSRVDSALDAALDILRTTDPAVLGTARSVGRAQLPSTMRGLLFHAAEHTARHAGQALTTFRIVRGTSGR